MTPEQFTGVPIWVLVLVGAIFAWRFLKDPIVSIYKRGRKDADIDNTIDSLNEDFASLKSRAITQSKDIESIKTDIGTITNRLLEIEAGREQRMKLELTRHAELMKSISCISKT